MEFDRSRGAGDAPAPPTPDEVAAAFPVPLATFVDQPSLEEAFVSRSGETLNGEDVMAAATLSYTVWRNPADHDDPVNLAQLPGALRAQLEFEPPWTLPDWLVQWRARMRHLLLWDAVRTTWTSGAEPRRTVEALTVEHVDYIVMNQFRPAAPLPDVGLPAGELDPEDFFAGGLLPSGPEAGGGAMHGVQVMVDGVSVPGVRIDSDLHVLGLGIELGDKVLTVAISRDWLPLLRLEFATRRAIRP